MFDQSSFVRTNLCMLAAFSQHFSFSRVAWHSRIPLFNMIVFDIQIPTRTLTCTRVRVCVGVIRRLLLLLLEIPILFIYRIVINLHFFLFRSLFFRCLFIIIYKLVCMVKFDSGFGVVLKPIRAFLIFLNYYILFAANNLFTEGKSPVARQPFLSSFTPHSHSTVCTLASLISILLLILAFAEFIFVFLDLKLPPMEMICHMARW